jgi:enoyl-CoA hydratase/carnithine racemase
MNNERQKYDKNLKRDLAYQKPRLIRMSRLKKRVVAASSGAVIGGG